MPKKIKTLFLLVFVIILLPSLLFSLYEFSTFSQYEKMVEETYKNELRTVLYSINEYSNTVIREWTDRIENDMSKDDRMENYISRNLSIEYIFRTDGRNILYSNKELDQSKITYLENALEREKNTLENLKENMDKGYKKLEAINNGENDHAIVFFVCEKDTMNGRYCGVSINTSYFINEILRLKIQEKAGDSYNVYIFNKKNKEIVFSTDTSTKLENLIVQEPIWFKPDYYSGISFNNTTIGDIIKSRTKKSLVLIIGVNLGIIFGVLMLFLTMKHQLELAQLKSEFISNVSHEIRTPLALIQMYIETLQMGRVKNQEKKKEYYNIIMQETGRLSGIVNKILNFTQIEKGKRKYQFSDTDINFAIEGIMSTYSFHLENKGFEYRLELNPDLPLIFADKEAVSESIINLIENAIKYSDDKKLIIIRTGKMNDKVFIEVKDFGIGISEKEQKLIFEKFYRVTTGDLALRAKGTGLGLTIVKHVMDAHKGEIILQSKKCQGSSFKLIFPQEGSMT